MKKFNSILHMYSNMDSSSQLLIFLIILVSLMLVSIFIINYATKRRNERILSGNKTSKKISKLKSEINNDIKPSIDVKNKQNYEPKEEMIDIIEDIPEEIVEVEEVVKVVPRKTSIEDITRLMEDTLEQEPINLTKFEEDQEENAIISYDELVRRAGAKKIIYKCEEENNILDKIEKKEEINNPVNEIKEVEKKFKASKVISPIFGVQKEVEEKDEVLESFVDLEKFGFNKDNKTETENKNDVEFLTSLKEFRSGLE